MYAEFSSSMDIVFKRDYRNADPESFGLKTSGLTNLVQIFKVYRKKVRGGKFPRPKFPIRIPNFFGAVMDKEVDNTLKQAYKKLTSELQKPTIIMVRSSDPDEKPGKFHSGPCLYSPDNFEESWKGFIIQYQNVLDSGARAVLTQINPAKLRTLRQEYGEKTLTAFGVLDTGFVFNSKDYFLGRSSVTTTVGLPSKIVRGDKNISITFYDGEHRTVNLANNYKTSITNGIRLDSIDVIFKENPLKIENVDVSAFDIPLALNNYFIVKTPSFHISATKKSFGKLSPNNLISLEWIAELYNDEVEFEGIVSDGKAYFVQERTYRLPEAYNIRMLSDIEDYDVLLKTDFIVGGGLFSGDVVVSSDPKNIQEEEILLYTSREYDLLSKSNAKKMILTMPDMDKHYFQADHAVGMSLQIIRELQDKGIHAIMLDKEAINELLRTSEEKEVLINDILKDVTLESIGSRAQVYKN